MTTLFISHSSKDKGWAERTYTALSVAGYRCLFLDSHPDDGIHAGADWEQTLYQRLRQSRGVVVLCSANWLASPWCVAEAIMARERKRRVFLLATADIADGRQVKRPDGTDAPQIPEFLKDKQFISLSDISEDKALQRLLDGLAKEGLNKKNFELPARPYPGLEPFTEKDGAIFFGRDEEVDQVIDVLHRRRKRQGFRPVARCVRLRQILTGPRRCAAGVEERQPGRYRRLGDRAAVHGRPRLGRARRVIRK